MLSRGEPRILRQKRRGGDGFGKERKGKCSQRFRGGGGGKKKRGVMVVTRKMLWGGERTRHGKRALYWEKRKSGLIAESPQGDAHFGWERGLLRDPGGRKRKKKSEGKGVLC